MRLALLPAVVLGHGAMNFPRPRNSNAQSVFSADASCIGEACCACTTENNKTSPVSRLSSLLTLFITRSPFADWYQVGCFNGCSNCTGEGKYLSTRSRPTTLRAALRPSRPTTSRSTARGTRRASRRWATSPSTTRGAARARRPFAIRAARRPATSSRPPTPRRPKATRRGPRDRRCSPRAPSPCGRRAASRRSRGRLPRSTAAATAIASALRAPPLTKSASNRTPSPLSAARIRSVTMTGARRTSRSTRRRSRTE